MAVIRPEQPVDIPIIRVLNEQASGRPDEGKIIDAVRQRDEPIISLVAVEDDQIVGHILFSPVTIQSPTATHQAGGLGPVAVRPDHQRRGIGGHLIKHGLRECREAGYGVVVVLGHPSYYARFGFGMASARGIHWKQEVPGDPFMVLELAPGALEGCTGVARYLPEFMSL